MVRGARTRDIDYLGLYSRYISGESGMEIAADIGIKWPGLYRAWSRLGLPRRSRRDAARVQRAMTRERSGIGISEAELILAAALRGLGYDVRHQMAVGPYNVDLTIESHSLIIEVDGGGHSKRSRDRADARRAYIEQRGWKIVHVWAKKRSVHWLELAISKVHGLLLT